MKKMVYHPLIVKHSRSVAYIAMFRKLKNITHLQNSSVNVNQMNLLFSYIIDIKHFYVIFTSDMCSKLT